MYPATVADIYVEGAKCGAQWPEREGIDCRVCTKSTEGTTMKADDVYMHIADNVKADNSVKQQAVARAVKRKSADIGCEDLVEVAAECVRAKRLLFDETVRDALRIDGFKAEVFGKPGARGPYELRVSVPVPPQIAHELGLE